MPSEARGGTFAPADMKLIRDALVSYAQNGATNEESIRVANLIHRIGRINSK